ncbi:MAG: hypothetical protein LBN06_10380 [Prevotellaceae bacterium]|jgi:hypothetical protein|nr:hypothetical protein [Prevotellaceae bacterium]
METKNAVNPTKHLPRPARPNKPRKTIGDIYGKLKRGLDGMKYQSAERNG